jgi:hypothetical protein
VRERVSLFLRPPAFSHIHHGPHEFDHIAGCRRDLCWNLIGGLRLDEDTWSGSEVNRLIGEFLGQALPSIDFAHGDLT